MSELLADGNKRYVYANREALEMALGKQIAEIKARYATPNNGTRLRRWTRAAAMHYELYQVRRVVYGEDHIYIARR